MAAPSPHVGIIEGLRAIISISTDKALQDPTRVTVTPRVEAMSLPAKLQQGTPDVDEFEQAWIEHLKTRCRARKKGAVLLAFWPEIGIYCPRPGDVAL